MIFYLSTLAIIGIGLWLGISLIRNRKYKYGVSIIIASLAFFGGYNFLNNLSFQFNNTKQQLGALIVASSQTMALRQNLTINNNLITEVKKEIANLNETIKQIYENWQSEIFQKKDIGKRVMVFKRAGGAGNNSIVYFQLEFIPVINSVTVSSNTGVYSQGIYNVYRNIVIFRMNVPPDTILTNEEAFYYVNYLRDYFSDQPLVAVVNMNYTGTPEHYNAANFQLLNK